MQHISGQLLIIPDAHRHGDGDDAYQLRDRAVFCDLAGPKFTHHCLCTLASLELAIVPYRVSSSAEIKITISRPPPERTREDVLTVSPLLFSSD